MGQGISEIPFRFVSFSLLPFRGRLRWGGGQSTIEAKIDVEVKLDVEGAVGVQIKAEVEVEGREGRGSFFAVVQFSKKRNETTTNESNTNKSK